MYWRVAAVDDSGNIGEVDARRCCFKLPIALKVSALGSLRKGKTGQAHDHGHGPGAQRRQGREGEDHRRRPEEEDRTTKSNGKTPALKLSPRKREKVTITVSKAGYKTTTFSYTVR